MADIWIEPPAPDWNQFVDQHPAAHFLQLREWGNLKDRFGWTSTAVALRDDAHSIRAGALILFRPLINHPLKHRFSGPRLAYVPRGPLVDWSNAHDVGRLLAVVEEIAHAKGVSVLKIEPSLPDTRENREMLADYGFRPSNQTIQPQSTVTLDIDDGEDQILSRMKSKWRYNIRLSQRKDVKIRQGNIDDVSAFSQLMHVTGDRNRFYVHSAAYFEAAFRLFTPQHAVFLFAEYQQQPLGAVAIFQVGNTAWYPWGGSSDLERNRMPNHALHWAAILWARSRGAATYDLWGIPDSIGQLAMSMTNSATPGVPCLDLPVDLQNLPPGDLWGVYRLKQGFGGKVIRYIGAWDRPIHAAGYRLYQLGMHVRSKLTKRSNTQDASAVPLLEKVTVS